MNSKTFPFILLSGVFLRMTVAAVTWGTNDADLWSQFTSTALSFGLSESYHQEPMLNHPPLMLTLLSGFRWFGEMTSVPFPFLLKMPGICAEMMLSMVLFRGGSERAARFIALNPILILFSGFHANTDSLLIACMLIGWMLAFRGTTSLLGGFLFGCATNIKLLPLVFIPALLVSVPRDRLRSVSLGTVFGLLVLALSFLSVSRRAVEQVVGYSPMPELWGLRLILLLLADRLGIVTADAFAFLSRYGGLIASGTALLVTILFARFREKSGDELPDIYTPLLCGISSLLILSPGFGVQYLSWISPLVLCLPKTFRIAIILTHLVFIFSVYSSGLLPGWPLHVVLQGRFPVETAALGLVTWGSLFFILLHFATGSRGHSPRSIG